MDSQQRLLALIDVDTGAIKASLLPATAVRRSAQFAPENLEEILAICFGGTGSINTYRIGDSEIGFGLPKTLALAKNNFDLNKSDP
ncbi:MAG: hypothetical protein ACI87E_000024 [Mariniblastus sp.]